MAEPDEATGAAPERASLVLLALILVAGVANLNLSVANVALPDIGKHFDSSQTMLDLIAVGYSLGLAASVLYLGAVGDRYGRKLMLLLGLALSVPACLLAAFAPSDVVLFAARVLGGLSAGMAYPTTLALIAALWSGPGRTKSIALWSALGGAIASLGPLVAGALLEHFDWGSVFLITLPLVVVAFPMAAQARPGARQRDRATRSTTPAASSRSCSWRPLILAINFALVPNRGALTLGLAALAASRCSASPCASAAPPTRSMTCTSPGAASSGSPRCAGIIVFGSLMGAAVHQPAVPAERARLLDARRGRGLPADDRLHGAGRAALGQARRGARRALHADVRLRVRCVLAFLTMLLLWEAGHPLLEGRPGLRVHRASASGSPAPPPRTR